MVMRYVNDLDVDLMRAGGSSVTISDEEPENPPTGSWWFDWSAPRLMLRYDHENWREISPTFDMSTTPPLPPPGPGDGGGPVTPPPVTPPWDMTFSLPGNVVVIGGTTTSDGRFPITTLSGWDPSFAADLNDTILYMTPGVNTSPANQTVRLFATFTPPGTEVEVDWDKFGLGTSGTNRITRWSFDSTPPASIVVYGSNSTTNAIQFRLSKA